VRAGTSGLRQRVDPRGFAAMPVVLAGRENNMTEYARLIEPIDAIDLTDRTEADLANDEDAWWRYVTIASAGLNDELRRRIAGEYPDETFVFANRGSNDWNWYRYGPMRADPVLPPEMQAEIESITEDVIGSWWGDWHDAWRTEAL
jgi:hypothetical protein